MSTRVGARDRREYSVNDQQVESRPTVLCLFLERLQPVDFPDLQWPATVVTDVEAKLRCEL